MATTFNMKDLNPGTWFKIDENDPESGEICIRTCGIDDIKQIRKATVTKKKIFKNGQIFHDEIIDDDLQNTKTWDVCIQDWRGIIDVDGNEIPCTKEMKLKFMGESIIFAKRVTECIAELNKMGDEEEIIEEKN